METVFDYMFKVILIGDSGVGKTSLMKKYTEDIFTKDGASTIGVDFNFKTIVVNKKKVKLQIWDTAGQERFRAIVSHYYRGADGIMLVFDMLNKESFEHLKDWMAELDRRNVSKTIQFQIIGNKIDCKDEIQVTEDEIKEFLKLYNIPLDNYYCTSAQDGVNVEECFVNLTKNLINTRGNSKAKITSKTPHRLNEAVKRGGCC